MTVSKVERKGAWFWSRGFGLSQSHLSATPKTDTTRKRSSGLPGDSDEDLGGKLEPPQTSEYRSPNTP